MKKINKFIDLHFHLDGSITVDIAKKLAELQKIDLGEDGDEVKIKRKFSVQDDCDSLNQFLNCFELPLKLLQTKEGITEAVRLVADNILSQGVIYAEFRFAPQKHMDRGLTQEQVVLAAIEGTKQTKLRVNLILCLFRGDDEKNALNNYQTLELAKKYLNNGIVAIDLAGSESDYKTEKFKDYFDKAKEYGIPFTIHAGEDDGPESIKHAIEFGAKRIGHGTNAFKSESVLNLIKEKGIVLEMCPTSNVITKTIEKIEDFPFMKYLNQGIKVT